MAQISLYVKDSDLHMIEDSARKAGKSISSFIISVVMPQIKADYSMEFKQLFGSVQDESFRRPDGSFFADDVQREAM